MKFTVQDKNNQILYTGTKQDCMHFIKRKKINRQEITIQKFDDTPTPHVTIPVTSDTPPPTPGFFKRFFN